MKKTHFRPVEKKRDAEFGYDLTPDIVDGEATWRHTDRNRTARQNREVSRGSATEQNGPGNKFGH